MTFHFTEAIRDMRQVMFRPTFEEWQKTARQLLREGSSPETVLWVEANAQQRSLNLFNDAEPEQNTDGLFFAVPAEFIESAKLVAPHADHRKWSLLYRIVWRLTLGKESSLLQIPTDIDVITLADFRNAVQKDAYRMRAFLRFRETRLHDQPLFVAWYEPEHDTVQLNEHFFTSRFTNMRWSILTPKRCMHWDGTSIRFSPGTTKRCVPAADELEPLWIAYYSNIFNPARVNPSAMQAQLLKRNWKNLPEASVIEPLVRSAGRRTAAMLERSDFLQVRDSDYSLAEPPANVGLNELRRAAAVCRACPLWKTTTCTVFGEGPSSAKVVLVGEQPGDQEDRAGKPFVGPAGQVLDAALRLARINRPELYVTNAVKHFKYEPRGKRRIHQTPRAREIGACRPWLEAELKALQPRLIVALGATAAQALFKKPTRILKERGRILDSQFGRVLVTIHPSALLRLPNKTDFEPQFQRFVADLAAIHTVLVEGMRREGT
jgi:uracil-DNA glycosylase